MIRKSAQIPPPLLRPSGPDHAATNASAGGEPETRSVQQQRDRATRLDTVPLRFLRFNAVRDRTGLSRSTIWRLERTGGFPQHRRLSTNAVGWLERDVNDWVEARLKTG